MHCSITKSNRVSVIRPMRSSKRMLPKLIGFLACLTVAAAAESTADDFTRCVDSAAEVRKLAGDGAIYFTDPDYGLRGKPSEIGGNWVFHPR